MASAEMLHFGLDPGKLACWLGGEYIGERREVNLTLGAVKDHVSTDNFNHMKQILLDGSPFELTFDKTSEQQICDDSTRKFKELQRKPRASSQDNEQGGLLQPHPTPR